jgi:hypothetical protein
MLKHPGKMVKASTRMCNGPWRGWCRREDWYTSHLDGCADGKAGWGEGEEFVHGSSGAKMGLFVPE